MAGSVWLLAVTLLVSGELPRERGSNPTPATNHIKGLRREA
jgi:hypothetical protein